MRIVIKWIASHLVMGTFNYIVWTY